MQKGITLRELAERIESNKAAKRYIVTDTRKATIEVLRDAAAQPQLVMDIKGQGVYPLRPLAHDQIGARVGIPSKYYDRMQSEAPDLLAQNVNHWLHEKPEVRMIRTMDGWERAFLSQQYQRIENEHMAEAALPVIAELPGVIIPSAEITDRRMYIHFIIPTIEGEVKKGDIVQAGGIISNSEVGLGACSVSGLIWRLVCLNGMKTSDTFRRNHVGRRVEESDSDINWADDTRRADDQAVLLKIRDMVRAVVDETRFRANLAKLSDLATARVSGNPMEAVELVAARVGATEGEKNSILRSLIEGGDLSAWGLVNAVTAQAHSAASYDRAVELEAAGGALVDLPASEWRRVLEAA